MKVHTAKSGLSLKLSDRWSDPIKIVEVVNNTVGVRLDGKVKFINQAHVKPL